MAHHEPPHQDLRCLQIQLFESLVVKELSGSKNKTILLLAMRVGNKKFTAFKDIIGSAYSYKKNITHPHLTVISATKQSYRLTVPAERYLKLLLTAIEEEI